MTDTERDASAPAMDWGRYGRTPALVLAGVGVVDGIDRGILPGVLSKVQDDFGFSDTRAGFLATAFVITSFLVSLPAGYLVDRVVRTRLIAIVLLSWGVVSGLNAAVRTYWQFLLVRAALGMGETVDNPASQSLLSDYYRPEVRGRAFAFQRASPIVGAALGTIVAGAVGQAFGWRWAFLVVGVPGSIVAIRAWRLPEPRRGESDDLLLTAPLEAEPEGSALDVPPATEATTWRERRADLARDVRAAFAIPTLRAVVAGTAIAAGALGGLNYWATAFYERHTNIDADKAAAIAGGLILVGALVGTIISGRTIDRVRDRYEGAHMLFAGLAEIIAGCLLIPSFLPVPLPVRMGLQGLAASVIIAGLLPLSVMISEVVPAHIRGIAYSVSTFLAAFATALSPLVVGVVADRFKIHVDGELKGDLAKGFLSVTWLVIVGGFIVLRGRKHVAADTAAARVVP